MPYSLSGKNEVGNGVIFIVEAVRLHESLAAG